MRTVRISIVLALLGALVAVFGASPALAYTFPSTNEQNKADNHPYVELVSQDVGEVTLDFVNDTNSLAFFEYRIDGVALTSGTAHPVVAGDFIYPGVSVDSRNIADPVVVTQTFQAEATVEVRLALGGERDWDFDWVTFDVLPPTNDCDFADTGTSLDLNGDCTTTATIFVPDGYTLNGNGYTITAVDPEGGHYVGAIVQNAGASMNVQNLTVTADALANVCDADPNWLVGILLRNASGNIVNNQVIGVNQGASGCQEGSGIMVANVDDGTTFPNYTTATVEQVAVEIARNVVDDYQKRGIAVFGNVDASIHHNRVGDSATQANLAANSVHLDWGATGVVSYNTIYGNQWLTNPNWGASAVLLFETNDVTVRLNTITGASDYGIYITDWSTGARVLYNRVSDYGNPDGAFDSGILDYGSDSTLLLNFVCGFETSAEYGDNARQSPIGVIGMRTCFDWFSRVRGR